MQFIKNIQFTKLFKVDGYLKEFNFRRSNASGFGKYSVDTIDERGNRIMMHMEKAEAGWKILPQDSLPLWVIDQENNLAEAIGEEESNSL